VEPEILGLREFNVGQKGNKEAPPHGNPIRGECEIGGREWSRIGFGIEDKCPIDS